MERLRFILLASSIILFAVAGAAVGAENVSVLDEPAGGPWAVKPVPMLDPDKDWYKPFLASSLMLPSERDGYAAFQETFVQLSTMLSRKRGTKAVGRWILPKQNLGNPPEYWNMVEVLAPAPELSPAALSELHPAAFISQPTIEQGGLAYRVDNLYLAGFANSTGHWHSFKDEVSHIPGAIQLSFTSRYTGIDSLMGQAEFLVQLELGQRALDVAFQVVLHYDPGSVDDLVMKRAVATVIVMTSEAARFRSIRDAILAGWETGVHLTSDQAKLIVSWNTVSCALILSEQQGGKWDMREANTLSKKCNIKSAQQAANNVNLLLYPSPGTCSSDVVI